MATSENQKPDNPESTGFIPGEDAGTRWRNWYAILTGKMNEKGLEQYVQARDLRNEEADCKRCEKQRDYLLQFSKCAWTPVMT
jgi:inner membrane protease ATP23